MAGATYDYKHGETTCEGHVCAPEGEGRGPAVLVFHAWAGQTDAERGAAARLAELGYVGIAADVYGKGVHGDPSGDNSALMGPFLQDRALLRDRLMAAVEAAKAHPRVDPTKIAAMGYCFGGLSVLDIARTGTTDVKGVVSIHGIFPPPDIGPQAPIKAKVLVLHGWEDPMAKPESVLGLAKEMTEAAADWQVHAYGHAMHAFTHKEANAPERGLAYDEAADRRSWVATTDFFKELFG